MNTSNPKKTNGAKSKDAAPTLFERFPTVFPQHRGGDLTKRRSVYRVPKQEFQEFPLGARTGNAQLQQS